MDFFFFFAFCFTCDINEMLVHRTINLNMKFPLHVWRKSHLKLFKHKSNFLIFQLSHKERVGCVCRSKEEMG